MPVPLRAILWGLSSALSVSFRLAVREPALVGEKVTLMVQEALTARLFGQLLVCAKSPALVPVMAMLLIVRAAVPLLVRLTVCAALVVPVS